MNTTIDKGICGNDFAERAEHFGSNKREPPKRTPFCRLFIGALEDFMLRILLVCAVLSISLDMGFADHDELSHGNILLILIPEIL